MILIYKDSVLITLTIYNQDYLQYQKVDEPQLNILLLAATILQEVALVKRKEEATVPSLCSRTNLQNVTIHSMHICTVSLLNCNPDSVSEDMQENQCGRGLALFTDALKNQNVRLHMVTSEARN